VCVIIICMLSLFCCSVIWISCLFGVIVSEHMRLASSFVVSIDL